MRKSVLTQGAACLLLMSSSVPVLAQASQPLPGNQQVASSPVPASGATKGTPPSNYVRCDGNPNNITAGETIARVIALSAVVGLLAPPHEAADVSKRLSGQAGIDACSAVIDGEAAEHNPARRVQLILARAIHQLEVKDYDGAIRDARLALTDQPLLAETREFGLSLGLSTYEIEAMALLGKGDPQGAKDRALAMAAAAPYDLITIVRAGPYVALTDKGGEAEQAHWAAAVRAFPEGLNDDARAHERAGDFAGAARLEDQLIALVASIKEARAPALYAHAALDHAFSGDMAKAETLFAAAREQSESLTAEGRDADAVAGLGEMLDFYAIWSAAQRGDLKSARIEFAGRSHWTWVEPALLDRLAEQLRAGATPGELIGTLARPAGSFLADDRARKTKMLVEGGKDGVLRYRAIRDLIGKGAFSSFTENLLRAGPSRYAQKTPDPKFQATLVDMLRTNSGIPAGYALLLDSAHIARAKGLTRFQIMPYRRNIGLGFVRFGNPGDPAISEDASYDVATVETALSPLFPRPRPAEPEHASLR